MVGKSMGTGNNRKFEPTHNEVCLDRFLLSDQHLRDLRKGFYWTPRNIFFRETVHDKDRYILIFHHVSLA